jgi:hypothetical protein
MTDQELDTFEDSFESKNRKPIFLIVICIISLVEAGWSVIASLSALVINNFNPTDFRELDQFNQLEDMELSENWIDPDVDFVQMAQYDFMSQWISLASGVLIFVFAFAMLKRKKQGFYPYIVTKVLMIIVPLYLTTFFTSGSIVTSMFFWIAILMAVHHGVFILMFWANKKHLR